MRRRGPNRFRVLWCPVDDPLFRPPCFTMLSLPFDWPALRFKLRQWAREHDQVASQAGEINLARMRVLTPLLGGAQCAVHPGVCLQVAVAGEFGHLARLVVRTALGPPRHGLADAGLHGLDPPPPA